MRLFRRLGCWLFSRPAGMREPTRARLSLELLEDRTVPSVNPIIAENLLPGTPQSVWDVGRTGDPTIQGFATDISVDQGQTISFKINDPQLAPYRLDIYRLGYYGGMGARHVATVNSSQTLRFNQPSPIIDPVTGLIDAGNWAVSASWAVPTTAVSGIYIANAVREDTGSGSQIVFIVRDDDGQSDILFQTSDTTWQAYNRWGGNSLYGGTNGARAVKVSYNRPFDTRASTVNGRDFVFGEEYPMVRWLEANGYNVSYFTDVDSDRRGAEILEHDVFLSVGHDEYWSGQQRANVEAARDAGVNLAFFSGNEVYWKTRWETSIDGSGTPFRTLVTYKETHSNAKVDPSPEWTGTWRDPRFSPPSNGGRPENALTGQIFTVNRGPGGETGTSMNVPAEFANLRFWRNTSVALLQTGQTAVLGDQVLGYEWDEDLDNGFRPAGLVRLSSTTQNVPEKLLDFGSTVGPGTATHSLTLYRAPSGALVFGAGTVQWAWGLDGTHDGPVTTPDPAIGQATVNLFADMGVKPGTLQPGLVPASISTDLIAPTSTITNLTANQEVTVGTAFTVNGTAADTGGGVLAAVEISVDGGVSWHRTTGRGSWSYTWVPSTAGPAVVRTRAVDDSLNLESPSAGISVSVRAGSTSTTGLVAAYSFDQGSGTALTDSAGQGHHGTIAGASWAAGHSGQALSFDGVDDWVTVSDSSALDLTNGMTVEAWVNPAALTNFASVVLKERPGGLSYALYAADGANSPPAGYVFVPNQDRNALGLSELPLNTWSHLATTYDGSTLRLFVNGTEVGSRTVDAAIVTSNNPLRIGGNSVWGEFFNGRIDNVRVYNRALSEGEIRTNMSTPVGGTLETTPPTGSVTPPPGGTVSGVVNVAASASDNVAVAGVQFLLDGQPLGVEDVAGPYTIPWDTRTVSNGSHTLTARVRDMAGNFTTTSGVAVTVSNAADTTAPIVTVTQPASNLRVAGTTVISASASDNIGVVGVTFKVDGNAIGSEDTSAPFQLAWNTAGVADGSHQLVAVARDAAGNVTTSGAVTVIVDNTAPTVTARTPAPGATLVNPNTNVTATLSESILFATATFELRDASGNLVPALVSYDDATRTLTLNPTQDLDLGAAYTATLAGVRDVSGNVIAASVTWSFTTNSQVINATLWDSSVTPAVASAADTDSVEVGVKFRPDIAGYVTGLRFYKGAANTGTHVGHLWDVNGNLLATATFTNETSTGWQQVNFGTPVAVTANTTYIASYFAPNGGYALNANYFTAAYDNGRLHAPESGASGGNGVYRYGGGFPTSSFGSSNYWVDVVFSNVLTDVTAPTLTGRSPAPGSTGASTSTNVTATFSEDVDPATVSFQLRDAGNNLVSAAVSYNDAARTVTLDPTNLLAELATYTATLSGARDAAGNTMTTVTWSFTTSGPDTAPPTVVGRSPAPGATGVAPGSNVTATFSEAAQFATISFLLRDPSNNAVAAQVTYNDVTHTVTLNPTVDLAASTTYTAALSGAQDLAGNTMTAVSWSFTTEAAIVDATLWGGTAVPAVASANDPSPVEVGLKFQADRDGYVTGLRFYTGPGNTGTHLGHLWTAGGTLLASATFVGETSGGWQQVSFASPVLITANTTYVASYYAPAGGYAYTGNYFAGTFTNGPLKALATGAAGGNGIYRYGAGGGFPTLSFNATNYWVDVAFSNTLADLAAPVVVSATPSSGANSVSTSAPLTAAFNEEVQAGTVSFVLRNAGGTPVAAAFAYDAATRTATLAPTAPLAESATYTATVSGAKDLAGNTMANFSWSFTTAGAVTNATLWGATTVPVVASAADTDAVELGMKFRSTVNGFVTGLRFYKGAGNTGTHVGHLWTASGTLLTTATFTGETATGWQQVTFSTPVAVTANTTYVASYLAPNGGYSYDHGYFTSSYTTGPLKALASGEDGGNGVYRYGAGGGFPSQHYNSANYWVDVVFSESLGDSTAPTVVSRTPGVGVTGVARGANVVATFSEAVQPATISFVLRDQNNATVAAAVTYDAATRVVTLNPTADLVPLTTYTATLSGATDAAGNAMTTVVWSFTVQGIWSQSSLADFSTGTHAGTAVTDAGGGALQLAPSLSDEFGGTALAGAWGTGVWNSSNLISVSGGNLSVQGAQVLSANTFADKPVEGSINFGATAYQHFGFATGFDTVQGNYWAMFSTNASSDALYARVNALGTTQDVLIGALPSGFHTYRVEPTATGFKFFLDGELKTTINIAFPTGTPLRVALSSYNGTSSPAIKADWVRLADYTTTGTYTSVAFDAGQSVTWQSVNWTASVPAGTTMRIEISVSDSATTGWSNWAEVVNGALLSNVSGRYIRYRVTFTTTDPTLTAVLYDINLTWH